MKAVRAQAVVEPGGILEIRSPELPPPGTPTEVLVLFDPESIPTEPLPPLSSFVGTCKGRFKTPEEIDEYLNRERDSWG